MTTATAKINMNGKTLVCVNTDRLESKGTITTIIVPPNEFTPQQRDELRLGLLGLVSPTDPCFKPLLEDSICCTGNKDMCLRAYFQVRDGASLPPFEQIRCIFKAHFARLGMEHVMHTLR
jgi:hypothetical protein